MIPERNLIKEQYVDIVENVALNLFKVNNKDHNKLKWGALVSLLLTLNKFSTIINTSFRVLDFAYKFECFSIYMKITTKKSNFSLKTIIESKKKEIKYETIICERFDV